MQPKIYFILIWHTLATLQHATQAKKTAATPTTPTTMSLSVANVQRNDSVAIIAAVVNGNGNENDNGQQKVEEKQQREQEQDGTANENNFEQLLSQKLQQEQRAKATSSSKSKLLSRKRRYLIFPEGSSFQLVYDEIVGVVDYTNYLILGITVALAWELPSKPPSEILEDIKDQLNDGTLGTKRNDTATNITYVDTLPKSTLRPNYINLSGPQGYGGLQTGVQSGYDSYYTNRNQLQQVFRPPMHKKYYSHNYRPDSYYKAPPSASKQKYAYDYGAAKNGWRRKDNYYYSPKPNPFTKWSKQQQRRPNYGFTPYAGSSGKYPWWNLNSRLSNAVRGNGGKPPGPSVATRRIDNGNSKNREQLQQQQQPQQQQQQRHESGYYQSSAPTASAAAARKHRIYPVFGKRSIPDGNTANATNNTTSTQQQQQQQEGQQHHSRQRRSGIAGPQLSKLDRIHIRHQRSTRQSLYEKIEKYLDKRGASGHHCVLRALCETGQKSTEHVPGSFVGELMRAVFTLPEALSEDLHAQRVHYLEQRYDAANAFGGSCAGRYQLCKDSLWMSQFVA